MLKQLVGNVTKRFTMKNNPALKTIGVILIVLVLFFIIVTQSLTIIRLRYDMSYMADSQKEVENQNKILTENIQQMGTEKFIEENARQKLGMVMSGETPIKVEESAPVNAQTPQISSEKKLGLYLSEWYESMEETLNKMKQK
jgi:cell division protein FtsB